MNNLYYETPRGKMYLGDCEEIISSFIDTNEGHKANLIFTSPPFPLNRAKRYGNMTGEEYLLSLIHI